MRISDWSSDVCSSDLRGLVEGGNGWKPERPAANSLRLLPSGPDRVGEDHVRPTSAAHMAGVKGKCKSRPGYIWGQRGPCILRLSAGICTVSPSRSAGRNIWPDRRDRKGVVWGKGGCARGDLGGRRRIT